MTTATSDDEACMRRALSLAQTMRGRTWPNPTVGCVIVAHGQVVGEGLHEGPGRAHAEVAALAVAGPAAAGATAYVTLEPCCHWGRTPPCTDALLSARIGRVVVAIGDPNPKVSGRGLELLRKAGVAVEVGLLAKEARVMNEGFCKHVLTGMPFVTAKWAMTLDGRIAAPGGDSKWVTSAEARAHARRARTEHGAVLVGVGTVLADDPLLSSAAAPGGAPEHPIHRIVLDSKLRTPPSARLLASPEAGPVFIFCSYDAPSDREAELTKASATVVRLDLPGWPDCATVLRQLGAMGITACFAEGGSAVLGSLFDGNLVDRVVAYVAPSVLTGGQALSPIGGAGRPRMRDAIGLRETQFESVGPDLMVTGLVTEYEEAVPCSPES